jgi:hypothetical protein
LGRAHVGVEGYRSLGAGTSAWPCFPICEVKGLCPGSGGLCTSALSEVVLGAGREWILSTVKSGNSMNSKLLALLPLSPRDKMK